MKPLHYFFIAAALMMAGSLNAQVAINTTGAGPDGSAILIYQILPIKDCLSRA